MTYGIALVGAGQLQDVTEQSGMNYMPTYDEASRAARTIAKAVVERGLVTRVLDLASGEPCIEDWTWLAPMLKGARPLDETWVMRCLPVLRMVVSLTLPDERAQLAGLIIDPLDAYGTKIAEKLKLETCRETLLAAQDRRRETALPLHVAAISADGASQILQLSVPVGAVVLCVMGEPHVVYEAMPRTIVAEA